ncbi:hypothetical protein [Anabaena sp. CCY 9910]|uniref:hypothetical protein n=1 Tax=Anabaena sp. CCY 9910 TaxID=3103870 RepID=UPI0039DF4AF8
MTEHLESTQEQPQAEQQQTDQQPENNNLFQAIGVVSGDVLITGDLLATVTIKGREYFLKCARKNHQVFKALKHRIEDTGSSFQTLMVYPKATHFPKPDQPHNIYFELVAYKSENANQGLFEDCNDFEFKLCGLWQFIPVSKTPCISVFKNYKKERIDFIKSAEMGLKVKYMKAAHIPLMWRDAIVPPFRFNPKASKDEQAKRYFVQIKAKFAPEKNIFFFDSILGLPTEDVPRFLKASKTDKAEVIKQKRQQRKDTENKTETPKPKPKMSKPEIKTEIPKPKPKKKSAL